MNKDFCYCNGIGCAIKEHCVRYADGLKAKSDDSCHNWMDACDVETRNVYIPTETEILAK